MILLSMTKKSSYFARSKLQDFERCSLRNSLRLVERAVYAMIRHWNTEPRLASCLGPVSNLRLTPRRTRFKIVFEGGWKKHAGPLLRAAVLFLIGCWARKMSSALVAVIGCDCGATSGWLLRGHSYSTAPKVSVRVRELMAPYYRVAYHVLAGMNTHTLAKWLNISEVMITPDKSMVTVRIVQ